MKKLIFFSVFVLFFFASCKKNGSSPSVPVNTISATIDGKNEIFNSYVSSIKVDTNGIYSIAIAGYQDSSIVGDWIGLGISGPSPVKPGSYISGNAPYEIGISYKQSGSLYYNGSISANLAKMAITSLTSTNIQGTFSGALVLDDSTPNVGKTVTDGKFNINFK